MTQILNLDELADEVRTIKLNGETHEVIGMSVEGFIKTQKALETLGDSEDLGARLQATVEMIVAAVPSLDRNVLAKMKIEKLNMIAAFINGTDAADAAKTPAAGAEGDAEKK